MKSKKIKKFYIEFILAYILSFIIMNVLYSNSLQELSNNIAIIYGEVFLLQIYGFPAYCATGVAWFLSALVGGTYIVLFLIKYVKKQYMDLLPFVFISIYGFIAYNYHQIGVIMEPVFGGVVHIGLLRAFAGISLGIYIAKFNSESRSDSSSVLSRITLTILEMFGYIVVIAVAILQKERSTIDFLLVIVVAMSIAITLSNKSYSSFLDVKIFNFLGKFSLSIYLKHFFVATIIKNFSEGNNIGSRTTIYLLSVLVLSGINYLIAKKVRKILLKIASAN